MSRASGLGELASFFDTIAPLVGDPVGRPDQAAADSTNIEIKGESIANVGWGNDGTVLYLTSDMYLCRIKTKTKGAGF